MAAIIPDIDDVRLKALKNFAKEFGEDASVCACAPGRVNLIGEHTDYNEGFVLPMALSMVTVIAGRPDQSTKCTVVSLSDAVDSPSRAEFDVTELSKPGVPKWANYVKGCIANFSHKLTGFNAIIASSVPVGAGLSSSAALEVATYTCLEVMSGCKTEKPEDKAKACQRAEHEFAGVPCGIMDQFISVMGKEDYALLLDCRDLTTKQIPMKRSDEYVFLITNSNTPHRLSSSAYCDRRNSCEEAAKRLGKKSLRDATLDDLLGLEAAKAPVTMIKRARHVITEIQRTLDAAAALEEGDFIRFGRLMNESHDSLREDYEVSSEELDSLVMAAREIDGVLGSRLTGAGFGGCTVTLLRKDAVSEVIDHIKRKYLGTPTFYIAKPAGGAKQMDVN